MLDAIFSSQKSHNHYLWLYSHKTSEISGISGISKDGENYLFSKIMYFLQN